MPLKFLFDRLTHEPVPATLAVGAHAVPLRLVRNARARRFLLRLAPDGAVRVTVPRGGSVREALEFARRQQAWLAGQLEKRRAHQASDRSWKHGTEVLFRGECVTLTVTRDEAAGLPSEGSSRREEAPINAECGMRNAESSQSLLTSAATVGETSARSPGFIRLDVAPAKAGTPSESAATAPLPGSARVAFADQSLALPNGVTDLRPLIENQLFELASRELPPRVIELEQQFLALVSVASRPLRRVSVRNQRSRWGSCSVRGTVSLNWRLIQAPVFVRDYIIFHELAHLREMNHSARYWQRVEEVCPGWREAEKWLKAHAKLLR